MLLDMFYKNLFDEFDTSLIARIPHINLSSLDLVRTTLENDRTMIVHGSEERHGNLYSFKRSVRIPDNIDPKTITKEFDDDCLILRGKPFQPLIFNIDQTNTEISVKIKFDHEINQPELKISVEDDELIICYKNWRKIIKLVHSIKYDFSNAVCSIEGSEIKVRIPKLSVSTRLFPREK